MAATFTTGTINQPDAGSVGLEMMNQIRDDLVAHAAWDLVEEFTPSSGAMRWYVFKCLAAQSGLPSDFYMIFGRRLSDGVLRMFMCEEYTTGSKTARYFLKYNFYNQQAHDELGRNPTGYILTGVDPSGTADIPLCYYWVPAGTSTKWWIIVSEDSFTVAFNGVSNGWMSVGAYIPLCELPIAMPIQARGSQGTNGNYGSLTRNPAIPNVSCTATALSFISDFALGFAGDFRYNDALLGGSRAAAELGMRIYEYNTGEKSIYGSGLGKLKRVRTSNGQIPGGLAFGDAYVLQGRLWVPTAPTEGTVWDTGVPSS